MNILMSQLIQPSRYAANSYTPRDQTGRGTGDLHPSQQLREIRQMDEHHCVPNT